MMACDVSPVAMFIFRETRKMVKNENDLLDPHSEALWGGEGGEGGVVPTADIVWFVYRFFLTKTAFL